MDIKDIVKSTPEGATHYAVDEHSGVVNYYKDIVVGASYLFLELGDTHWEKNRGKPAYRIVPLPPRTKVEYIRVEDSIFHPKLQSDFESDLLFYSNDNKNFVAFTGDERTLMRCLLECSLYRRIETPINEREEFIEGE